jgi:hypothetical protein
MSTPSVSDAIVVWTGKGIERSPRCDDELLVERFGADTALDLVPAVRRLYDEFYESDARQTAHDLLEMGRAAADRFRQLHPEIEETAVQALTWCYTYDFK